MGTIDVYNTDEIFYDDTLVCQDPDEKYDRLMRVVNGYCIALKDGKCTIYEKRPAVCRAFAVGNSCCENIRKGFLNSHSCKFCQVSEAMKKAKEQKEKTPTRELDEKEKAKGRSAGYWDMSSEDQWAEDKRLGILDWDGN